MSSYKIHTNSDQGIGKMKRTLMSLTLLLMLISSAFAQTQGVYKEDTPHRNGDQGMFVLFKRCDVAASSSGTDGDYTAPCVDNQGQIRVSGTFTAEGGSGLAADDYGTTASPSTHILTIQGNAAGVAVPVSGTFWQATQPISGTISASQSGAWSVTANAGTNLNTSSLALESGGNLASLYASLGATTANRSTSTDTTSVPAISLLKQISYSLQSLADGVYVQGTTSAITDTTSTSVIAGVASNYLYISKCSFSNTDTDVGPEVVLQDGSGGTVLDVIPVPMASAAGDVGGAVVTYPTALKVPTAGNALYCAPLTTGASVKCSCNGYRSTTSY
jgi:hypothetical protein